MVCMRRNRLLIRESFKEKQHKTEHVRLWVWFNITRKGKGCAVGKCAHALGLCGLEQESTGQPGTG